MGLKNRLGQIGLLRVALLLSIVVALVLFPSVFADNISNFTNQTEINETVIMTLNIFNDSSLDSPLNLSMNIALNESNGSVLSTDVFVEVMGGFSNITNISVNTSLNSSNSSLNISDEMVGLAVDEVNSDNLVLVGDELLGTTDYYVEIDDVAASDPQTSDKTSEDSSGLDGSDSNKGIDLPVGGVVAVDDEFGLSDLYVALDDEIEIDKSFTVELSDLLQGDVVVGEPVSWYQEFKIRNDENESKNLTINLANYDDLPDDFLSDVNSFAVYSHIDQISETPVFNIQLEPLEEEVLTIIYRTAPVLTDITCKDVTVADLIPGDAVILSSDVDLSSVVLSQCNLRVYHNSLTHYENVKVDLGFIPDSSSSSIYYVEGDKFLELIDGVVTVPETV